MSFAARQNISRFRERLKTESDPARRETLLRLLKAEEAKLRRGGSQSDDVPSPHDGDGPVRRT
jgi:hypothetical protein